MKVPGLLLSAALLPALIATAEEAPEAMEIAPLVVTGSRYEASSFNLPFAVQRVDDEQATLGKPGVNLSEALGSVPGLTVQNRNNYAQDLQVSSRGFGARSAFGIRGIKLLADGIPLSNPDGQGQLSTYELDALSHIEVLRGPFTNLYGSSSGGVIQLFSRDGSGPLRASAGTALGEWDTRRSRVGIVGGNDQGGIVLNQSYFSTGGYREQSSATVDKSFAKLTLTPDLDTRLNLIYVGLQQDDSEDPQGLSWEEYQADRRAASPSAVLFNTRKDVSHEHVGFNLDREMASGTLQGTVYAGIREVTQYQSIPLFVQNNPRSSGGVIDFRRNFHGASTRWIQPMQLAGGELTLTAGLEYDASTDDRQGFENFIGDTLGVKGALRRDEDDEVRSLGAFIQSGWTLDKLNLQAGLRHSHVEFEVDDRFVSSGNPDDSGSTRYRDYTPNLGAGYLLNPDLSLYASWSRGFETPTLNELFYSGPDGSFAFDLDAASSEQYEAGIKARLGNASELQLALFQIDTEDEIVVESSLGGRTRFQNAGRTQRQGVELAVESQLGDSLEARLAATLMSAEFTQSFTSRDQTIDSGLDIPNIPERSLFGELLWQPVEDFHTGIEGYYRSSIEVEDSNTAKAAPSYAVFNWVARYEQQLEQLTFHQVLRLDNLLDRDYIGSIIVGDGNGRFYEPAPGRSWYAGAGLEYRFE